MLIAMSLCGCMNKQMLRDLAVVEGMGIDKKGTQVQISVQTLNLAKEGNGSEALSGNITMNSSEHGSTISEAISKLSKDLSRKLFLGQNKMTVFSRELAEAGMEDNLDYLIRSSDSRPDVLLCVSDGAAQDVLKSKENDALVPAENMVRLLKNGERSGMGACVTVNETLKRCASPTSDFYLPLLKADKEHVSFAGLALFDDSKMTGVADSKETFGILLMNGKIKDGLLNLYDEEFGHIGVEIVSCKVKPKTVVENGSVVFRADFKLDIMLDEMENGYVSTIDNKTIEKIEQLSQNQVNELCAAAYSKLRSCKCDGIKAGEYLARSDKDAYAARKDDWDTHFSQSRLQVTAKCKLTKINDNSIRA